MFGLTLKANFGNDRKNYVAFLQHVFVPHVSKVISLNTSALNIHTLAKREAIKIK
jgi:hypothetical protein